MVSMPHPTGPDSPERVSSGNLESMESVDPTAFMNPMYSSTDTSYGMASADQPEHVFLGGEQHQSAMNSNEYDQNQGFKSGVNGGYQYMNNPSSFRQDPAQMYGSRGAPGNSGAPRGGANGYARNRGGRDGGYRNQNNGWNQQYRQHNMMQFPHQAFQGQAPQVSHYNNNFPPPAQQTGPVGDMSTMEADANASQTHAHHQNGQDTGYASSAQSYIAGELPPSGHQTAPGYHPMHHANGMVTPTSSLPTPGMSPMMNGQGANALHQGQPPQPMPIGIYPYSHLGYGGKIPGVNGNVSRRLRYSSSFTFLIPST
jgi:hypothetical protein